jgi:hypothetical protein
LYSRQAEKLSGISIAGYGVNTNFFNGLNLIRWEGTAGWRSGKARKQTPHAGSEQRQFTSGRS